MGDLNGSSIVVGIRFRLSDANNQKWGVVLFPMPSQRLLPFNIDLRREATLESMSLTPDSCEHFMYYYHLEASHPLNPP